MKILLIHPPIRENAAPCNLPLGLAYTASALKLAGIEYQVLDLNVVRLTHDVEAATKSELKNGEYTHVGISAMITQFSWVEKIVCWIRATWPADGPIIVGGPISVLGRKLARWLDVAVFKGESEQGFAQYLQKSQAIRSKHIISCNTPFDLNTYEMPDWPSFNMDVYANNPVGAVNRHKWSDGHADADTPRSMNMLTSRGCPNKCTYCAHDFAGMKYRTRPVQTIIREMMHLYELYDIRYFHFSDDNTTVNKKWLTELCEAIATHPNLRDCTWGCAGRVDSVDHDTLVMMRDSGCRIIGYGVESGSQKMLDVMRKGVTVKQIIDTLWVTERVFGRVDYSLIAGTPGESGKTIRETIQLCKATATRPEVVFYMTPYPGTELYGNALRDGLIKDELAYVRSLGEQGNNISCNVSGQTDEWLRKAKARILTATKDLGG